MKHILNCLFLIAIFLFASNPGLGAEKKEMNDTLNPGKIQKQIDSLQNRLKTATLAQKSARGPLVIPRVTGVGSLLKGRSDNLVVFGDYIYLTVDSIAALTAVADSVNKYQKDTLGDVILYINGNAMRDIVVLNIDRKERQLIFHLDRHSQYLLKFYPEFTYLWSRLPVNITAGFKNGKSLPVDPSMKTTELKYVSSWAIANSLAFMLTIVVSFIILASKTNLIRIGDNHSPFSLALTQLSFWTIVIASSFIYIWIVTEEMPKLTGSTLILLSISAFTTAGSRLVDIRSEGQKGTKYHSDSFIEDILKDELGYSVHRAQMFMWTVIMGIIFVTSVIRFQQIPQLDETLLGLMGISSGAYVGLKTMENKKEPESGTVEEKGAGEEKPL